MEESVDRLVRAGIAQPQQIMGCSPEEAGELEIRFGVHLPKMGRAFLLTMVRGAGTLLVGNDLFYPDVLELRGAAEDLLTDLGNPFELPEDAIAFLMHQSYQFLYFRTSDGADDPKVHHFVETTAAPRATGQSFTQFLQKALEDQIALRDNLGSHSR